MKSIGLVPMAAKPYHAGHDGLVRIAARENTEAHVFVSTSDRKRPGEMTISGRAMQEVWQRFIEPSLPSNVKVFYGGTPVRRVYETLEAGDSSSDTVYRIYSDNVDVLKYTDAALMKNAPNLFQAGLIERRGVDRSETVNISGTRMRAMLAAGDVGGFSRNLPPAVQKDAAEIIDILRGNNLTESLLRAYVRALLG